MQRVVPPIPVPIPVADQCVLHNESSPLRFSVGMNDVLDVNYIDPSGTPQTYTESISGLVTRSFAIKQNTDAVLTGDIYAVYISQGTTYVAISNRMSGMTIDATNNLRVVDFRNADLLSGFGNDPDRVYIEQIYTHPSNPNIGYIVTQIISETTASDGILWLHTSNPDAASMRSAAEAKGWTVYEL